MSTIGFIGLGNMGFPMASNLASAGHRLVVHDQATEAVDKFLAENGDGRRASEEGWTDVDVIITMLPTSAIVSAALLGDGVVEKADRGTLFIDMSSAEPAKSVELGTTLREAGMRYVDAPVSGGVRGAVGGKLAIMLGGSDEDLSAATEILEPLSKSMIRVGDIGTGHAAKALNNLVSAASVAATVEALHIGSVFGIDPGTLNDVFNASSGRSNTSENKVEQFMLSGTFGSGFPIGLMSKDVSIALTLADQLDVPAALGHSTGELWSRICTEGFSAEDHTRMYEILDRKR